MHSLLAWLAVAAAVLLCSPLHAQTGMSGEITLRDAMRETLQNNPELTSFPLRERSLQGQLQTAALRPPLVLNSNVENVLGTDQLSGFGGAEANLSLSSVLELGGKRAARMGMVNSRLGILEAERRIKELDLLAEVAFRFIALAAAQERLAIRERATGLAEQALESVARLVAAGQSPAPGETRARAALERTLIAQRQAEAEVEIARRRLAGMWASQSPGFEAAQADLLSLGSAGDLDALLASLEENPEIQLFAARNRLQEAELREAESRRQADVQWTAGVRRLQGIGDTGLVMSFSMPLGADERASGALASARARRDEVEAQRRAALNRMSTELYALHRRLEQSLLEAETLREEVLPGLETALEQTRDAYARGLYSYFELISARNEYVDAELALVEAAAAAHRLRVEMERLSGTPLLEMPVEELP